MANLYIYAVERPGWVPGARFESITVQVDCPVAPPGALALVQPAGPYGIAAHGGRVERLYQVDCADGTDDPAWPYQLRFKSAPVPHPEHIVNLDSELRLDEGLPGISLGVHHSARFVHPAAVAYVLGRLGVTNPAALTFI